MGFKTRPSRAVLQQHFKEAVIAVLAMLSVAFLSDATQIWDFKPTMSTFQTLHLLDFRWNTSKRIFFKTKQSKVFFTLKFQRAAIAVLAMLAFAFLCDATQICDFKHAMGTFHGLVHACLLN
jgi:hypothetical protein